MRIARFCSAKGCHAPNFAEKTFAYSHKTEKSTKVFCTYVKISAVNSLVPRLRPVNTNRQLIVVLKHLGNLYRIE